MSPYRTTGEVLIVQTAADLTQSATIRTGIKMLPRFAGASWPLRCLTSCEIDWDVMHHNPSASKSRV